jgi:hypothetical protein
MYIETLRIPAAEASAAGAPFDGGSYNWNPTGLALNLTARYPKILAMRLSGACLARRLTIFSLTVNANGQPSTFNPDAIIGELKQGTWLPMPRSARGLFQILPTTRSNVPISIDIAWTDESANQEIDQLSTLVLPKPGGRGSPSYRERLTIPGNTAPVWPTATALYLDAQLRIDFADIFASEDEAFDGMAGYRLMNWHLLLPETPPVPLQLGYHINTGSLNLRGQQGSTFGAGVVPFFSGPDLLATQALGGTDAAAEGTLLTDQEAHGVLIASVAPADTIGFSFANLNPDPIDVILTFDFATRVAFGLGSQP